ncbi:MAG: hypothetical protein OHK0038_04550 [Flammeovirgaceae bacterium]
MSEKNLSRIMRQNRQERKGQLHYTLQKINKYLLVAMSLLLVGTIAYYLFRIEKIREKREEEKKREEKFMQAKEKQ